MQRNPV